MSYRTSSGDGDDKLYPVRVQGLADVKIVQVSCGGGDAHTLAVDSSGKVWSWGDGDYGKLGRGGSETSKTPKPVINTGPGAIVVVKVVCGNQFSVALSNNGHVYTW